MNPNSAIPDRPHHLQHAVPKIKSSSLELTSQCKSTIWTNSNTAIAPAMSAEVSLCAACHKPSSLRCGACRQVAYCSREHQKLDWKTHKKKCERVGGVCFEIAESKRLGRHLVAARTISQGEIVLEEEPLVSGPLQWTPPVCLGCYTLLNYLNSRGCSRCGWPVCSEKCERSVAHRGECEVTTRYRKEKVTIKNFDDGIHHPSYQCLTVLRCLHLKSSNPNVWDKLSRLESHSEERKSSSKYENDLKMIAKFIPEFFKWEDFTEEEIMRIVGIVQVNAHFVPLKNPGYVSVYENSSLLEHSCRANCSKSFSREGRIVVRAAREILKGEHLSISYTEPLWGMQMRQDHLRETKFFLCECERCTDPTELGTHFNSLRCPSRSCPGYAVPSTSTTPAIHWRCTDCKKTFTDEDFSGLFARIKDGILNLDKQDAESCKGFLKTYERFLHPNHFFLTDVRMALIQFWKGEMVIDATDEELASMVDACRGMIDLTSRLVPAENRLRGALYFHLHAFLSEISRRKIAPGTYDDPEFMENLLMFKDLLGKSYAFLKTEPDVLLEGKMAAEALECIRSINEVLKIDQ